MLLVLLSLSMKNETNNVTQNSDNSIDLVAKELNYPFLLDSTPEKDQYLMLLAKRMTEDYGTYESSDLRSLESVKNQSTESFKSTVQNLIDKVSSEVNISTEVDPNSIELTRLSENTAKVQMDAITTNINNSKNIEISSEVKLYYDGTYWLVDNITFINK